MRKRETWRLRRWWPFLLIVPAVLFFISFALGRYPVAPAELVRTLWQLVTGRTVEADPKMVTVLLNVRLPRVAVVLAVGAGMSMAGAAYQGMFRNPLVSPDILGATAGASFGAALALLSGQPASMVQLYAFVGGMTAVLAATYVERTVKTNPVLALVLGGMLIQALFNAGLSIIKYLSDPEETLPAIVFWLMGTFTDVKGRHILQVGVPLIIASILLFYNRQRLNVLTFSEEEARALGVNTKRVRRQVIAAGTLLTASSVSICGQIGWVGLIIPHLARSVAGPDYRQLLPVSAILGSSFLLICDTVCRNAFPVELPIGILTSVLGIPFFLIIFKRKAGSL
ncbi:MAG: iron ABC transporter permease [Eubacteriales bacterium]|nr:iron ABC transporter permease [Eubacteriales bacterium]